MDAHFLIKFIFLFKNKWIVDDLNIAKNILNSNSVRTPHLSEFDEETASFF